MIRIFTVNGPNGVTVTVDGHLVDDGIDAVESCIEQAMSQAGKVRLYLRDVSLIDKRGRALLARLAAKGVHLSASGVYSSYVVSELSRDRPKAAAGTKVSLHGRPSTA